MYFVRLFQAFVAYCFIGWVMESILHTVWERKLVNRGFLNGPYVPIYGFGALLVLHVLEPFQSRWYIVFPVSIILATTLEYITGWAMEKLFHNRWWDYSMFPFNLHGRICLLFSLGWGVLCLMLVYIVSPFVNQTIMLPPQPISIVIAAVIFTVMLTDLVFTIRATVDLNKTLARLDTIGKLARARRDDFAGNIQHRLAVMTKAFVLWSGQAKGLGYIQRRLLRAFPSMKSPVYQESIDRLRTWVSKRRRPRFFLPAVKIPDLRKILDSIELPPRPVLKNPFANGKLGNRLKKGKANSRSKKK